MKYIMKVDEHYVHIENFNIKYVAAKDATKFDTIKELVDKAEELHISGYEPEKV